MSFLGIGKKRELPPNTHGNLPDIVSPEEQGQFKVVYRIENPPLLTETQLREQIGEDMINHDPFSFMYTPTSMPCFKRAAVLSGVSFVSTYALTYFRCKQRRRSETLAMTAWFTVFAGTWIFCRMDHRRKRMYEQQPSLPEMPSSTS